MTSPRNKRVCFVADRWCLDRILALPRESLDGIVLVPLKFDLFLTLKHQGFACVDIFERLEDDDIKSILAESTLLTDRWFEGLEQDCTYRGFVVPALDKVSLYCFFHDAVFATRVIRSVIERDPSISEFVLFPNLRRPQEIFRPATDVVTGIAHWIASERGLAAATLDLPPDETAPMLPLLPRLAGDKIPERPLPAPPTPFERLRAFLSPRKKRGRILIALEGMTLKAAIQLGQALGDDHDISFVTTWLTWEEMEALSAVGELIPIGLPYREAGEDHASRFAQARERIGDGTRELRRKYPEIFANPHLSYQFDNLMGRRWPELCEYLDILAERLSGLDIDAAILCSSVSAQGYALFQALADRCPRILMPHTVSLVSNQNLRSLDPVFRNAEVAAAALESEKFMVSDVSAARFETTGSFQFDEFASPRFDDECRARGRDLLSRHGVTGKIVALVVANVYTNNIAPLANGRRNLEAFRALFDIEPELKGRLHFVIKAKTDYWDSGGEYFQRIVEECGAQEYVTVVPTSESLSDLSAACDFAVGVNSNSSGYFYPILFGRPLLHIQTIGIFGGYGDPQTNFYVPEAAFETATDLASMRAALRRLTLDVAARREAGERGKAALLSVLPLDPAQRFRKLIGGSFGG